MSDFIDLDALDVATMEWDWEFHDAPLTRHDMESFIEAIKGAQAAAKILASCVEWHPGAPGCFVVARPNAAIVAKNFLDTALRRFAPPTPSTSDTEADQ